MNFSLKAIALITTTSLFVTGCQTQTAPRTSDVEVTSDLGNSQANDQASNDDGEAAVAAAMAELSPEDRKEAEAQRFCAVMNTSLLGSMGTPLKLDVNGQPVFVCCAGCKSKAMKNADETLATVARLKAENNSSKE